MYESSKITTKKFKIEIPQIGIKNISILFLDDLPNK
jgi:hypothetical protein